MALALNQIGRFWKRYAIVITFPLIAASSIYADYSYTLQCKARANLKRLSNESLNEAINYQNDS